MLIIGLALGLVLTAARALWGSFFRVEEGHVAAVTRFGRALKLGGRLRVYGSGLHRKAPWDVVHRVCVMEQGVELAGDEDGRTAMASDGTVLRLESILRYTPDAEALDAFLFRLRAPVEHITGLYTCLLRNEIAGFTNAGQQAATEDEGSYALLRRERTSLARRIDAFCRERIGVKYGVKNCAVELVDVLPPDELAVALNAVIQARAEAGTHVAHAEADSRRRALAAEQGIAIAAARAKAVEIEMDTLGEVLANLKTAGTLGDYVARREAEVLSESKTLFLRRES